MFSVLYSIIIISHSHPFCNGFHIFFMDFSKVRKKRRTSNRNAVYIITDEVSAPAMLHIQAE